MKTKAAVLYETGAPRPYADSLPLVVDEIDLEDLMLSRLPTAGDTNEMPSGGGSDYTQMTLEEMERRHILATLRATAWNKSQTAMILGIERSTLDRKIRRYDLHELVLRRGP